MGTMQQFKKIRNIHFIGIGGSGMIGIATILHKKGYNISGSDILKTKDLDDLSKSGVEVIYSHKSQNIRNKDLIVLSSAISSSNIEVSSARKKNIPIVPRAEMLSGISRGYQGIAVAGSHGKTTTTSLIAHIFNQALLSPTYVIGGKILSSDGNSRLGDGNFFIFEADESDKSFLSFYPDSAVITNIDNDHLEAYEGEIKNLKKSFLDFTDNIPFFGYVVGNYDDKNTRDILKKIKRRVITFGLNKKSDIAIKEIDYFSDYVDFKTHIKETNKKHKFRLSLQGKYNIYNAVAAITIAIEEGISIQTIRAALKSFSGVERRFETFKLLIQNKQVIHIDDYGHHPREIEQVILSIRNHYKSKKILMIFQPHRYSRTKMLFSEFVATLSKVDKLLLLPIYAASEKKIRGMSSKKLMQKLNEKNDEDFCSLLDPDDVNNRVEDIIDNYDILITQGAGSVSRISKGLIKTWIK